MVQILPYYRLSIEFLQRGLVARRMPVEDAIRALITLRASFPVSLKMRKTLRHTSLPSIVPLYMSYHGTSVMIC